MTKVKHVGRKIMPLHHPWVFCEYSKMLSDRHFINSNVNFGILNRLLIDLSVPSHTMLVKGVPHCIVGIASFSLTFQGDIFEQVQAYKTDHKRGILGHKTVIFGSCIVSYTSCVNQRDLP